MRASSRFRSDSREWRSFSVKLFVPFVTSQGGTLPSFENLLNYILAARSYPSRPQDAVRPSWMKIRAGALPITYETFLSKARGKIKRPAQLDGRAPVQTRTVGSIARSFMIAKSHGGHIEDECNHPTNRGGAGRRSPTPWVGVFCCNFPFPWESFLNILIPVHL